MHEQVKSYHHFHHGEFQGGISIMSNVCPSYINRSLSPQAGPDHKYISTQLLAISFVKITLFRLWQLLEVDPSKGMKPKTPNPKIHPDVRDIFLMTSSVLFGCTAATTRVSGLHSQISFLERVIKT